MFKSKALTALLFCLASLPAAYLASAAHPEQAPTPQDSEHAAHHKAKQESGPFDWMVGHWVGKGLGGVVEEWWSPMRGGEMNGIFRLIVNDEVVFHEIMTIRPEGGTPSEPSWVMRLRHFHADLRGWEEKDKPLVWESIVVEDSRAGFGPVLYQREGKSELRVWVELDEDSTEEILYHRQ